MIQEILVDLVLILVYFIAYPFPYFVIGGVIIFKLDSIYVNDFAAEREMVRYVALTTTVICAITQVHYLVLRKAAFYFKHGEFAAQLSQDWHRLLFLGIVLTIAWVMCYRDPDEREEGIRTFLFAAIFIPVLFSSSIWGMIARFA